jgi:hypothetical protein
LNWGLQSIFPSLYRVSDCNFGNEIS